MKTANHIEDQQSPRPKERAGGRMSLGLRIGLTVLLLAAAAALAYGIYNGIRFRVRADSALKQETLEMAVPTVSVIHPKSQAMAEEVVLPGNVQPFVATPIFARINGYLKKWYFDIGTSVKAGQLLAEIDAPEVDQQLDQARADLNTAKANLQLAQTTAARYESLFKTESVSRQDMEDKAGDRAAKKAVMDSATSNVRRLEETQKFEKVYAPFDGVITVRNTDIGALINAGANTAGRELFDIASTGVLRVYVNVPQTYARSATPGSAADLTLAEFPGRHFPGKIARTAESIDPVSRTLLTEVDVDNAKGELLPGAYVSVHLKLASKIAPVVLPVNVLLFRSEGLRVAVVRDGKAILVPIVMGRDFGSEVEVLSGVTAHDEVILNPSDSLTSGTQVRVSEAAQKRSGK